MNFKELVEKRNEIVDKMDAMFKTAETEVRAFNEDENKLYEDYMAELKNIDTMMEKVKEARSIVKTVTDEPTPVKQVEDTTEVEERAFIDYIRNKEVRNATNWTTGDNGAVIPTSIANKIIETVENIAPVFQLSAKYNAKGTLTFPVYDESTQKIVADYATEFTALDSSSGKFTSISLGGHLVGALTKISRSLLTNSQFALLPYIINKMAESIARFLEHEILLGDGETGHMTGVLVDTNAQVVNAAAANAISADDLVGLQLEVPQVYQGNAIWVMSKSTLLAIRTLKDGENRYMLNNDITAPFGYVLLGKPVYISDNMPAIATKNKAIVYGDFSGMFVNIRPGVEMQVMHEKYADEHAVGVVAWFEADCKIGEKQKLAVLKMA